MTNAEARICRLEQFAKAQADQLLRQAGQLADLQQSVRLLQAQAGGYGGGGSGGGGSLWRAVVTTAIPTGTASSPSTTGRAAVYRWDPTGATSSADTYFTNVRVCNQHTLSTSIAVGKAIQVVQAMATGGSSRRTANPWPASSSTRANAADAGRVVSRARRAPSHSET